MPGSHNLHRSPQLSAGTSLGDATTPSNPASAASAGAYLRRNTSAYANLNEIFISHAGQYSDAQQLRPFLVAPHLLQSIRCCGHHLQATARMESEH